MANLELAHPRQNRTAQVDERAVELAQTLWSITDEYIVPLIDQSVLGLLFISIEGGRQVRCDLRNPGLAITGSVALRTIVSEVSSGTGRT